MGSLYAIHVVEVATASVVLDLWCVNEDIAKYPLPNPALHGFFVRVLAESADPSRPSALADEGPFDDDAVRAHAERFVASVQVRSTANYPGAADELPGVTYDVHVRDARWLAHLRVGDRWDTAAYQTVAVSPFEAWTSEQRNNVSLGLLPSFAREQLPQLCQAVSSYDLDDAGTAIEALGRLGAPMAVHSLIVALGAHDQYSHIAIALALGRIGPPAARAVDTLRRIFTSEPVESRARAAVGFALYRIAEDTAGFAALRAGIRPGADCDVFDALLTLDEASLRELVPDFLRAFAGGLPGDAEAGQLVYDLLALLAARAGAWAEPLRAGVERSLLDENHNVRQRAAKALSALGPPTPAY